MNIQSSVLRNCIRIFATTCFAASFAVPNLLAAQSETRGLRISQDNKSLAYPAGSGLAASGARVDHETVKTLHVADFGAVPDDGECDMEAINNAVQSAIRMKGARIVFDAGVYDMINTVAIPGKGANHFLGIFNAENLTLVGQADGNGRPLTRLERHVVLDNEMKPPSQVLIENSRKISLRNFVLTNNPPMGSSARVVSVDENNDEVVVEVFDGLPAYDGMRAASAHAWHLDTGKLKRFGNTPTEATLTIGAPVHTYWEAVPGTDARQLKMKGAGFAAKVEVGDGISWHQRAIDTNNQTRVMYSSDLVFENISMPNIDSMGMLAGYNHNMTFRNVRFEPEAPNLSVGSRDGIHLSMTSGEVLVENSYFKGLRMDPLVIRKTFGIVREILPGNTLVVQPAFPIPDGDQIQFWVGDEPPVGTVQSSELVSGGTYAYTFTGAVPSDVAVGTPVTYLTHTVSKGVIRNTVFEDNFGSAIVNFEENITVENCVFANNSYQIKYGPNHVTGGFVRNNIFRNNVIEDVSWIDIAHRGQPAALLIHSLNQYFKNPLYNEDIEISGNLFKDPHGVSNGAGIHIMNARHIDISGNTFEGLERDVVIDEKTTEDIHLE